jgi:hypothetical protein
LPWVVRNWTTSGRLALADVPRGTFVRFNLAYVVAEAEGLSRDEAAARLEQSIDSWQDEWDIIRRYPRTFVEEQVKGIARAAIGVESGVWARQLGYELDRQGSFDVLSTVLTEGPGEAFERLSALLKDPQTALHAGLTVLGVLHTLLLYLLALASVALVWRGGATARLVCVLVFLSAAYLLVAPGAAGQARFRIPVEPFLALLAGAGLSRLLLVASRKRAGNSPVRERTEAAAVAKEER